MKKLILKLIVFALIITIFAIKVNTLDNVIAEEDSGLVSENDFNDNLLDTPTPTIDPIEEAGKQETEELPDRIDEISDTTINPSEENSAGSLSDKNNNKTDTPTINKAYIGDMFLSGYSEINSPIIIKIDDIEYYTNSSETGEWYFSFGFALNENSVIKVYAKNVDKDISEEASIIPEIRQESENSETVETADSEENVLEILKASSFENIVEGVRIKASADAGVFPDGTEMSVKFVTYENEVQDLVENELNVSSYIAFDITFVKDGIEIQPNGNVNVVFEDVEIASGDNTEVYHVDDNNNIEQVSSEVVEETVTINSSSFSIYIITNPVVATYKFYDKDGTEISEYTQIVKNGENLKEPSAPSIEGFAFDGWYTEQNGGNKFDFSTAVNDITGSSDIERNLYARYRNKYYVFFMDNNDRVIETKEGKTGDTITDLLDVSFPTEQNKTIAGWTKTKGSNIEVGDSVTLTDSDITLYPILKEGYWLIYESVGGTYVNSYFCEEGELPTRPSDPKRNGYTFDDWYIDSGYTQKFDFNGGPISNETIIYAKWNSKNDTTYRIAYWIENADDNGYTYENSEERNGVTGQLITLSPADYGISHVNSDYRQYFTYDHHDTTKTISGDGTTVVNVYYKRNVYTVTFDLGSSNSAQMTIGGNTYTRHTPKYSITVKYNSYIGDKWPTASNFQVGNNFASWSNTGYPNSVSKKLNMTSDLCQTGGKNLRANYGATVQYHLYYMFESFDQNSPVNGNDRKLLNGIYYDKSLIYSQDASAGNLNWKHKEINGLSPVGDVKTEQVSWNEYNVFLYYNRKDYTLKYWNYNDFAQIDTYDFEAPLTGKFDFIPERPDGMPVEFVFKGWYTSRECYDGTEAKNTYTQMPSNNVVVYAKWEKPSYDFSIYLTVNATGTPKKLSIPWGGTVSETEIPKEAELNIPAGSQFLGWYVYVNGVRAERFKFDREIYSNITIVPYWANKSEKYHVTYNLNGGSGNVPTDSENYAPASFAEIKSNSGLTGPAGQPYFLGWENSGKIYYPGDKIEIIDRDIEFIAVWGDSAPTTSIIYNANGGTGSEHTVDLANNQLEIVKNPANIGIIAPSGYEFLGWNKNADGSGDYYNIGDSVRADINSPVPNKLFAIWVKLEATGGNWVYDGNNHELSNVRVVTAGGQIISGYAFTYSIDGGNTFNGTVPSIKNVGEINVKVKAESEGKLTLNKDNVNLKVTKAPLTITTASASKKYDGKPLTKPDGATINGLVNNETASISGTGTITEVGTTQNTYTINWGTANKNNYDITVENLGTLEITKFDSQIKLIAPTAQKEYDGLPLSKPNGVTAVGLPDGFKVESTSEESITDVGEKTTTVKDGYKILDAGNDDKTANFTNVIKVEGKLTVTKAPLKITSGSAEREYTGTALTKLDGVIIEGLKNNETIEVNATGSVTNVDEGEKANDFDIVWKTAKSTNYSLTKVSGKLKVLPKEVTIQTKDAEKEYDGTPLTEVNTIVNGFIDSEKDRISVVVTGKQTEVGSSLNTYTVNWNGVKSSNYHINETVGTLTVNKVTSKEIVITAPSASKVYDGSELSKKTGVTVAGLTGDLQLVAEAEGSITNVGVIANKVKAGFKIVNAAGEDKTANFEKIKTVDGELEVTKRPLSVKTGSATKVYDGTPLTKNEASITGFALNEEATIVATGTITEVGSTPNTYEITYNANTLETNYEIKNKDIGTLSITEVNSEVVITAASASRPYNGTKLTDNSVSFVGLPTGFRVEAVVEGEQTNVGKSDNVIKAGYKIFDALGNEKTSNFTNVKLVKGELEVTKAPIEITTSSASKSYDGTPLTSPTGTITGIIPTEETIVKLNVKGSITDFGDTPNIYDINWGTVNKENYEIVKETIGKLEIFRNNENIIVEAESAEQVYNGQVLEITTITKVNGVPSGLRYTAVASGSQKDVGESANVVDVFKIFDANDKDVTSYFTSINKINGKLKVTPKEITVKTLSAQKEYDGNPLTKPDGATVDGLISGESVTVKVNGSITDVGSVPNDFEIKWDNAKEGNYTVKKDLGNLTVTKVTSYKIKLTAESDEKIYDGVALTKEEVKVENLPVSLKIEVKASGTITNVGEVDNVVDSDYKVIDKNNKDVTENFIFEVINGKLKVNKKEVVVTTVGKEKEYDGTPLTNDSGASIVGIISSEIPNVKLNITGSQTEVGQSDNTYSIDWNGVNSNNYSITEKLGKLVVKDATTQKVVLTAPSETREYNGLKLSKENGVTVSGLPAGFSIEAKAEGNITDVGSVDNIVADGYIIKDANGIDKTSNFKNIEKVNGKLIITPAKLTVTTGSDQKAYDGTPLKKDEINVSGLKNGEKVTTAVTGVQTEVGESDNSYTITWDKDAKETNYEVVSVLGKLKVTLNDVLSIVVQAADATKVYDGTPLEKTDGVNVANLPAGFTFEAKSKGKITDAGETDNKVDSFKIYLGTEDKTANFTNIVKQDGKLTVNPAPLMLITESATKVYDGTPLKAGGRIEGLVNGETAELTVTGSQIDVGESINTAKIEWANGIISFFSRGNKAKKDNYTVTSNLGTLRVTEYAGEITVTTIGGVWEYDGNEHGATVEVSALPAGYTVKTATSDATIKNVADSPKEADCDNLEIVNAAAVDVTDKLNIKFVKGKLEITPKTLTVTTPNAEKIEDGSPLTAEGQLEGLVSGEEVTFNTTGIQTVVGTSVNTYEIIWDKSAVETNYRIVESLGTLTIKQKPNPFITPDKYLVTFLDCNGNTVKLEWVEPNKDATPPTGQGEYSGYINVSSHRDLIPAGCLVNGNQSRIYSVPNTSERSNPIYWIIASLFALVGIVFLNKDRFKK